MATDTYLELCQQLLLDAGISGTMTTVASQTGEFNRVTKWINRACQEIEGMWFNWNFLHNFGTFNTVASQQDYTLANVSASTLNLWDTTTVRRTADETHLEYIDWNIKKRDATAAVDGDPWQFTILPNKSIRLYDTPETVEAIDFEWWQRSTDLAADDDEPAVPSQFRYIIVARALIYYGNYESAEDARMMGYEQYTPLLRQLESSELPGHQSSGSINTGADIVVSVPGRNSGGYDY